MVDKKKTKLVQVTLQGQEIETFNSAMAKSGLRSPAELVRYLITQFDKSTEFKG